MRRSDRQLKTLDEIFAVIERCEVVRLAINTAESPYIVPMNFGVERIGEALTLWMHCAHEGLKLELISKDNRVGFECDGAHKLIVNESACAFTMEYESVIGHGKLNVCEGIDEKRRGLASLMCHYVPGKEFDFPDSALLTVCVLRLEVSEVTGKRLSAE